MTVPLSDPRLHAKRKDSNLMRHKLMTPASQFHDAASAAVKPIIETVMGK